MSQTNKKDPFKESQEAFTKLRNEKPSAEQVKNLFEKPRKNIKTPVTETDIKKRIATPKDVSI